MAARRSRRRAIAAAVAAAVVGAGCSIGGNGEQLSQVELGPPRLLDDGAGQRHFEVSYPEGKPRGTILFIHGGSWAAHGQATFARMRIAVQEVVSEGFRVVAISTDQSPALKDREARPDGRRVLDDVLAFYDQAAVAFPDEPICAHGVSGGGHLALLLAIERPELDCASAAGPPTDLIAFVSEARLGEEPRRACLRPANGVQAGACLALATWGKSGAALRRGSPALRWPDSLDTPVWAGFEQRDPVIPPSQRESLAAAVEQAKIEVLRSDPKGPVFAHGGVRPAEKQRANLSWRRWIDQAVPAVDGAEELPDGDLGEGSHEACNARLAPGGPWRSARRRDRFELLTAAGRWRPQSTSPALAATSSCDGREDRQEAGLSLWVPGFAAGGGAFVNRGDAAAWIFEAPEGSVASSLKASFRGLIANPGTWRVGLYSRASADDQWSPVAQCDGRSCEGLEVQPSAIGVTVVPAGARDDADRLKSLPEQTFSFRGEPTELKWELECVAPRGCLPRSINPGANPDSPNPRRPIDPTGRPAVLSLYELTVETAEP